ncbi:hypothetical protein E3N88_02196 [Mikania micrantha]|uniref:Uncharacterized protein n=1 Tax=Mikania micrantha TaxID=192012 RepID=A0A5N6Q5T1_9ASTR|nr:hypothetical protein E3N88_02196 [Mikania micrantha]
MTGRRWPAVSIASSLLPGLVVAVPVVGIAPSTATKRRRNRIRENHLKPHPRRHYIDPSSSTTSYTESFVAYSLNSFKAGGDLFDRICNAEYRWMGSARMDIYGFPAFINFMVVLTLLQVIDQISYVKLLDQPRCWKALPGKSAARKEDPCFLCTWSSNLQ